MKPYISIIFFFAILSFSMKSNAQKWKHDPSYSIHNYKHPNKASASKKANTTRLMGIKYVDALVPVSNNYKAQNQVIMRQPGKAHIMTGSGENHRANRNYKQQFAPTKRRKDSSIK